jgi:aryl-alcohol dehydrogenase-like predicted oxidoreductase
VNKEKGFQVLDVLTALALAHGATVPQIALAWILANDAVTSVIIGARKIAQLDDNLKSVEVTLSPDEVKALNEASKLAIEYPAWMDSLGADRRPGESRY